MRYRTVLACASLAMVTACGTQQSDTRSTSVQAEGAGAEMVAATSAESAQVVEEVRARFERWAGGLHARQAAAVVRAYQLNGEQDACLDAAGVPFRGWAGWEVAIPPVELPAFYGTSLAMAPPERLFSYPHFVNAPSNRLEAIQTQVPPDEYEQLIDDCGNKTSEASDDEIEKVTSPPVVDELLQLWNEAVAAAAQKVANDREILDCYLGSTSVSEAFGTEPGADGQAWLNKLEATLPPAEEIPLAGQDPSDAWSRYLDLEKDLLTALWECHSDTYDQAVAMLPSVIDDFEAEHAEKIEQAAQAWTDVKDRATELGWTPDKPLAGFPVQAIN